LPRRRSCADQECDLRDLRRPRSGAVTIFARVLRDARVLVLATDHEAGDVLQEDERDAALRAQLDEMRALLRRLAEQIPLLATMPSGMP